MKKSNHRRRRRAIFGAVSATAFVGAATAHGAPINTNLVINGGFENVDPLVVSPGPYGGVKILDWLGTTIFNYGHGSPINDFASGDFPPGSGASYFTAANASPEINDPGQVFQLIDLSTGETGALIPTGNATFNLSAYMSSYNTEDDFGVVQVDFFGPGGAPLGGNTAIDTDAGDDNVWSFESVNGLVPAGAVSARVSIYGVLAPGAFATTDAFIDNVDFQITGVPEPTIAAVLMTGLAALRSRRKRRETGT